MSTSIETEILKAIQTISLPPPKNLAGKPSMPQAGIDQGFVNDGSLVSLGEGLPQQSKTDALWWTLFASLAATAALERQGTTRTSDPGLWYNKYIETLHAIGMSASGFDRSLVSQDKIKATVDSTVLDITAADFLPTQLVNVANLFTALEKSQNDDALASFDSNASDNGNANFQILDGEVDAYLNLTLDAVFMDFQTNQKITKMLFWRWTSRDISFYAGNVRLTLPKTVADVVRDNLFEKIKNYLPNKIKEISLEN